MSNKIYLIKKQRMKVKNIFCVITIEINDGEFIKFSKDIDSNVDTDSNHQYLIRDSEPDPIDLYTKEEIEAASKIAYDEFKKRAI